MSGIGTSTGDVYHSERARRIFQDLCHSSYFTGSLGKHRQASLLVYLRIQLISKWFCLADKSGRDLNHDYYSLCSTTPLNSCYELMHTQDLVGKNTPKASACGTCLADRACRESMAQSGPDT